MSQLLLLKPISTPSTVSIHAPRRGATAFGESSVNATYIDSFSLTGRCGSLEAVSVVKKYVLALIGKVSAPPSRIQVIVSTAITRYKKMDYLHLFGCHDQTRWP